jgi:CO dehydrogenase maturation factor
VAFVIALSGKGGMGKTTLAALMVRHLSRARGRAVLAVDADPNSGLGEALGVSPEHTLADIREDTREDRLQLSAGMSKERHIELLIQSCLVEGNKFDLLTMGRPEGPKCYCYVNNLLRKYLDEATKEYPIVVIDNEAGMEHLSRRTTNNVDELFVVSDATRQGARTVGRIMKLADSLPIRVKRKEVLLNNIVPGADAADFRSAMREAGFSVALEVPYDRGLYQACAAGKPIFELADSSEALQQLSKFLDERVP